MYPNRHGWQPSFRKDPLPKKNHSNFRRVQSSIRSNHQQKDFSERNWRPNVRAGMFANAVSSHPIGQFPVIENPSDSHSDLSRSYSISPERQPKTPKLSRRSTHSVTWGSSSSRFNSIQSQPQLEVQQPRSVKERSKEVSLVLDKTEHDGNKTFVLPWLRKRDGDDETAFANRKTYFQPPPGFDETIKRFSARLDEPGAIPFLAFQKRSDWTMGSLEKSMLSAAINNPKEESMCMFKLMLKRSTWLISKSQLFQPRDFLPKDPFYTHDIISSDFEEYEQDKETDNIPSYAKKKKKSVESFRNSEKFTEDTNDSLSFFGRNKPLDMPEAFFNTDDPTFSCNLDNFPSSSSNFQTSAKDGVSGLFQTQCSPGNYESFSNDYPFSSPFMSHHSGNDTFPDESLPSNDQWLQGDDNLNFFDYQFPSTSTFQYPTTSQQYESSPYNPLLPSTSSNERRGTKRPYEMDSFASNVPETQDDVSILLANKPQLATSSEYSPFHYSYLSKSGPPSPSNDSPDNFSLF